MRNNAVISLDIRRRGDESELALVSRVLDEVLGWARDFLAADEDAGWGPLASRFEDCRAALEGGAAKTEVEALAHACVAEGRELIAQLQQLRAQRVEESFAVVEALRDVMATMGAEMTSMHSTISQSTERFEAIGQLTDPRQMKMRLMAEVLTLKQVAAKRRKAWEETARTLSAKVAALERDLSEVKGEATTDSLTEVANRRPGGPPAVASTRHSTSGCTSRATRSSSRFSTSTTSRASTTSTATPPATRCSSTSLAASRSRSGRTIWWRASAATSSRCWRPV